jgi:hypothetical protein
MANPASRAQNVHKPYQDKLLDRYPNVATHLLHVLDKLGEAPASLEPVSPFALFNER